MKSKNAKRNRNLRKKGGKMQLFKNLANKVYPFKQTAVLATIVSSTSGARETGYSFKLDDIPGYNDYTAIFDQYRFCKVVVKFFPRANTSPSVVYNSAGPAFVSAAGASCNFYTALDFTDVSALGALNNMLEISSLKVTRGMDTVTRTLVPRTRILTSSTTTYSTAPACTWLHSTDVAIPHYGVRTWLPDISAVAGAVTIDVVATYYLEFKNVK